MDHDVVMTREDLDDPLRSHLVADTIVGDWPKETHNIIIGFDHAQSRLKVTSVFWFDFRSPMPNGWHRFWQRILLGWTWERVEDE